MHRVIFCMCMSLPCGRLTFLFEGNQTTAEGRPNRLQAPQGDLILCIGADVQCCLLPAPGISMVRTFDPISPPPILPSPSDTCLGLCRAFLFFVFFVFFLLLPRLAKFRRILQSCALAHSAKTLHRNATVMSRNPCLAPALCVVDPDASGVSSLR